VTTRASEIGPNSPKRTSENPEHPPCRAPYHNFQLKIGPLGRSVQAVWMGDRRASSLWRPLPPCEWRHGPATPLPTRVGREHCSDVHEHVFTVHGHGVVTFIKNKSRDHAGACRRTFSNICREILLINVIRTSLWKSLRTSIQTSVWTSVLP